MLRLRTFGGVEIAGPNGLLSGAVAQRRPLALLALLAASERGITRDQLVAYLWPDSSEERARHALAQLLYRIRRELGEDIVLGDAVAVRLNPSLVSSDVADFREAVASNDLERAAAQYTGSFLEGFFLSGCDGFERWAQERRDELARQIREVLETLARRAAERGALAQAADHWRRLARLSPFDSRIALSSMKALVAVGDRAGALEHARVHEAFVRAELDADPDPSIVEFAASLKTHDVRSLDPRASSLDPGMAARADHRPAPGVRGTETPAGPITRTDRWRWLAAFVLGLSTLGVVGAVVSLRSQKALPKKWVLIADAENATGDPAFDRAMPIALAAAVSQSRHLYAVPPDRVKQALGRMRRPDAGYNLTASLAREIAQREGGATVAVPSAERSGDGFELSVRLVDPATGGVLSLSTVRAENRAAVVKALDRLGRDLRRRLGEPRLVVATHSAPLPLMTTVSLDALQKFADGGRAFDAAQYVEAGALWREAVALDSGFASAYASLGMLAYWTNNELDGARYYEKAVALAVNLPERERLRIRAAAEGWRGNRDSAVVLLRPFLASHAEDLDLQSMLAYNYLRSGRNAEAEEVLKRVTALDSLDHVAFINLATVQKQLGRYAEALVNYRRGFALAPAHDLANNNLNLEFGATYVYNGQPDSARAAFLRLLAAPDTLRQARALRSLAFLDMYQGRFASAASHLTRAADMTRASRQQISEIRNRLLLAQALEQLGSVRTARDQLEAAHNVMMKIEAPLPILLWVGKALARVGDVARADAALRTMGKRVQGDIRADVAAREILQGELLLARGRPQEALPLLRAGYAADAQTHALESLAYGLVAAGAYDSAATRYAQMETERDFGWEAQIFTQLASYWLGRVEEERGNPRNAREAYLRFLLRWKDGDPSAETIANARSRVARLATGLP